MKNYKFLIVAVAILVVAVISCSKNTNKINADPEKQMLTRVDTSDPNHPLERGGCAKDESDKNEPHYIGAHPPLGGNENMYWLRDQFLQKTTKGQEFTEYYYTLSKYIVDHALITTLTYENWYPIFQKGILVCSRLEYGKPNDIIITPDIYTAFKHQSLITQQSVDYHLIRPVVNVLSKDLDNLNGLTKAQFITYFQ